MHIGGDGWPVLANNSECLTRIGAVSSCECGFGNCIASNIVIVLLVF